MNIQATILTKEKKQYEKMENKEICTYSNTS